MILSAIGLPVPGASNSILPPSAVDRAEGTVQAVAPASAAGGSSSASGSDARAGANQRGDTRAGDSSRLAAVRTGAPRESESTARKTEAPDDGAIRIGRGRLDGPDRPAGPQPAFEIAVLEKLREDVMRIPPEARASEPTASATELRTLVLPRTAEASAAQDARGSAPRGAEARTLDAPADSRVERTGGDAAVARTGEAISSEVARPEPALQDRRDMREAAEQRAREPADEGFDDARRMSEDPVPRSLDLTR
jgi:hypothetical protein